MKSLVLDTNVAVRWLSSRRLVLELLRIAAEYDIVYSVGLLDEYERILSSSFGLTKQATRATIRRFCKVARIVDVDLGLLGLNMRDCTDEPILALCAQYSVDILVSDDLDFNQSIMGSTKLLRSAEFMTTRE
jgi:predicted nucleic acid-binding protein